MRKNDNVLCYQNKSINMELQVIQNKIHEIRGQRIMFDFDLAKMYKVETRVLKQAVRRNINRFPKDFMFQLSKTEWQEVITNCDNLPKRLKFSPSTPFAFSEQGKTVAKALFTKKYDAR